MKELRNSGNKTLNSKLEWQKNYDKNNMKTTGIKHNIAEHELWEKAAEKHGMKLSAFVRSCVTYCINNNIDIADHKENK